MIPDVLVQPDGRRRTFRVHVPASISGRTALPLVLAFHGMIGSGLALERLSGLDEAADRHGFLTVYPDGVGRSWNVGQGRGLAMREQVDDVGFAVALIDVLADRFPLDRQRVYATGISNGAMLVHRLACEMPDRIAAIAAVAGSVPTAVNTRCNSVRAVPVLIIHGTGDFCVPWNGREGLMTGRIEPVMSTVEGWLLRNRCSRPPSMTHLEGGVTISSYAPDVGGAEVVMYRVEGGGHTWPGGHHWLPPALVGATSRVLDASEVICRFFARHALPPR